jgi:inner membrane protein
MPSIFAHAVAGAAVGSALAPPRSTRPVWIAAALCAALPDIDALGRPFGSLRYEAILGGHRGFTHSVPFAAVLAALITWGVFRQPRWNGVRPRLWATFFIATVSHGIFDALSTIGNGVAFWAPFSWTHYEFGWQPLGDIGPGPRGPERLLSILGNELLWVGLPALIVMAIARFIRRSPRKQLSDEPAA